MTRIDLQVSGSPGGSASQTITAYAINTKGTGTSSGRMSGDMRNRSPIGVACVTSPLTGDAAAQKVSISSFNFMRGSATSVGWSCSVSGSEEQPVFSVGLLVPTILGQAESTVYGKGSSFSWGMSNGRMSIVERGSVQPVGWNVACASKEPRGAGYDLVMMKKV